MKTWSFEASYLVTRLCTITADTEEEARDLYEASEWDEDEDLDCSLQDTEEPDWSDFEE